MKNEFKIVLLFSSDITVYRSGHWYLYWYIIEIQNLATPTHVPFPNLDQLFLPVTTFKAAAFYDSPLEPSAVSPCCSFPKP